MIFRKVLIGVFMCLFVFWLGWWMGLEPQSELEEKPNTALLQAEHQDDSNSASEQWRDGCPERGADRKFSALVEELNQAREKIEALEVQLAMARMLERGYQGQMFGTPEVWPDDTPEKMSSRGFQALFAQSVDECQVPAELHGFDCSEPPCIAFVSPQQRDWLWSLIRDCSTWTDSYKLVPLQKDFYTDCENGQSERIVMMSPFWADYPGDRSNLLKRLESRWAEIERDWKCK